MPFANERIEGKTRLHERLDRNERIDRKTQLLEQLDPEREFELEEHLHKPRSGCHLRKQPKRRAPARDR